MAQVQTPAAPASAASPAARKNRLIMESSSCFGDAATAERAAAQIKKLGDATNAALDSVAKGLATRPVVQTTFSDNYAKEGVSYTVQKGDTLALIAKKNGARSQDIINANKISDPSRIMVGQTLFIPTPAGK